jgi:hypothetical protein
MALGSDEGIPVCEDVDVAATVAIAASLDCVSAGVGVVVVAAACVRIVSGSQFEVVAGEIEEIWDSGPPTAEDGVEVMLLCEAVAVVPEAATGTVDCIVDSTLEPELTMPEAAPDTAAPVGELRTEETIVEALPLAGMILPETTPVAVVVEAPLAPDAGTPEVNSAPLETGVTDPETATVCDAISDTAPESEVCDTGDADSVAVATAEPATEPVGIPEDRTVCKPVSSATEVEAPVAVPVEPGALLAKGVADPIRVVEPTVEPGTEPTAVPAVAAATVLPVPATVADPPPRAEPVAVPVAVVPVVVPVSVPGEAVSVTVLTAPDPDTVEDGVPPTLNAIGSAPLAVEVVAVVADAAMSSLVVAPLLATIVVVPVAPPVEPPTADAGVVSVATPVDPPTADAGVVSVATNVEPPTAEASTVEPVVTGVEVVSTKVDSSDVVVASSELVVS